MLLPGVLAGGSLVAAAQSFGFYFAWVLLPGLAFAAWLRREDDELLAAGMGLALGTVLLGLVAFLCRATGWFALLSAWPAATLVPWALQRRRPRPPAGTPARGGRWLLLALLLVVLVRVPTGFADARNDWYFLIQDLVFHAGNAAELLKEGPLIDPRVAGRTLNYHLLSHAPVAAMRFVTGQPISDLFRFWFLGFYPLMLVLLVFALAREIGRSACAGFAAVLVLVLHNDLGQGLFGEQKEGGIEFMSFLNWGLFLSPTTSLGLALLAAQGWALLGWCDPERNPGAREAARLGLLAMGASMAKGSVMPAAIAGAFFAFAVAALRRTGAARRWLAAALVLTVAALPATLYLTFAPGSYAGAMFRFEPWASALVSKLGEALLEKAPFLERSSVWLGGLVVALPWSVGFLGLGGVGALAWLAAGRPSLRGLGPWVLGTALAGLFAGTFLLAPGNSQLFFAYDAQLVLALPAGLGAARVWARSRRGALALALLALPFLAAGVGGIGRALIDRVRVARSGSPLWPQWCEGAAWLRENTGPGALLVSLESGLLLTQFAERRVALTEARYTAEGHTTRWQRVNGRWRLGPPSENPFLVEEAACEAALRQGDVPALARLRVSTGHAGELYLVRDEVEARMALRDLAIRKVRDLAALDASPGLERVFRNDAMAVYRVVE